METDVVVSMSPGLELVLFISQICLRVQTLHFGMRKEFAHNSVDALKGVKTLLGPTTC